MRRIILETLVVVGFLLLFNFRIVNAQMMGQSMMGEETSIQNENQTHGESLDVVLSELLSKYQVSSIQELNCGKISDEEFEKVGDAFMESMHPGETHERMDEIMGGEGSGSLRQAHIRMGKNYLGCSYQGGGMMPSNFGENGNLGRGMMGGVGKMMPMWGGFAGPVFGFYQVLAVVTWLSLIAFLLAGARWFWKKGSK